MSTVRPLLAALASAALSLNCANAAEITVEHLWPGKAPVVGIVGPINEADGQKFASQVMGLSEAFIGLSSEGGNLLAAIQIGEIIRARNFTTIVPGNSLCASSCALIWLAGAKRYIWSTARGFMVPSTQRRCGRVVREMAL